MLDITNLNLSGAVETKHAKLQLEVVDLQEDLPQKPKLKRVLSWSAGKDSTATGILAKLHNEHIDEIIIVLPDPFKQELELLDKFQDFMGMPVTIIEGPTFEDYFFKVKGPRSKYPGTIYGWPMTIYKTCARILKWEPIKNYYKGETVSYLFGIAKGETREILPPNESLLIKYGLTEEDARNLCIEHGLLNPLYEHFNRMGCVRCPKQGKRALAKVRELEPEKYQWCLDHDHLSPVTFRSNKTFHEFVGIETGPTNLLPQQLVEKSDT